MQRVEKTVDTGLLLEEYRTLLETVDQLPLTITGSSGDTLILPLIVPGGAARISTTHLWLQLLRAL